jgi:hypothetical protein
MPEVLGTRPVATRISEPATVLCPVGRAEVEADFRSGAACDLKQLSVRYDVDPLQDKQSLQLFGDIGIFVDEQARGALEDGDFASETVVRLCKLETNVAATDDDEIFGEAVQLEKFDIGEGLGFAQAGGGRDGGVRAQVEEDALADDRARASVVEANLKGFGAGEAGFAHDELSAGFAIVLQVNRDQRFDHLALAPPDGLHVDRDRTGDGAELTGMACEVGDLRAPNFIFRRKAIDVWAGAADPPALDDHGWLAQLRQVPG